MKKKIIAVILIWVMVLVWLVIATILTIKFLGTGAVKTEKLTITFDSDGGTPVEKITFEKGTMVELPTPTKEGFEFDNWSVVKGGGEGFPETVLTDYWTKFLREDVYVKALWKELQANEMVMTINFDAQGGKISGNNSKTSQSVVKCVDNAYTVEGLPTATKDGYTFMSWADQHGTPILNGASLVCSETLYLYATYQKNDDTKPATPEKTAKCPTGYELKDTNKCVKTDSASLTCDSGWKLINGECYNPSVDTKTREGNRTCPEKTINGWTGTGYLYNQGKDYCAYYEMPSYTGANQQCANAGGHIIPGNSYKCFKYVGYDYSMTCSSGTKYVEAQAFGGGSNPGCYYYKAANKTCPDGYSNSTTYGDCAKVIDATYE